MAPWLSLLVASCTVGTFSLAISLSADRARPRVLTSLCLDAGLRYVAR